MAIHSRAFWPLGQRLIVCAIVAASWVACGNGKPEDWDTPLNQAYRLMDAGRNSEAISLLRAAVAAAPDDPALRTALASACMGVAGVDLYRLFDHFEDIVFARSLSELLWEPAADDAAEEATDPSDDAAPVARWVWGLNNALGHLRRLAVLAQRFPHVAENDQSLVAEAIRHLDSVPTTPETAAYRLLARLILLKSNLDVHLMSDRDFGSRKWLCRIELVWFAQNVAHSMGTLHQALRDYAQAFVNDHDEVARWQATLLLQQRELIRLVHQQELGAGAFVLQNELRLALSCGGD